MQLTLNSIMNRAMVNPDLLVIGLVAGFILAKLYDRRRNSFGGSI
ncbi:MAG: hypothetical protein ABEJ93_01685 [Candidatus Nanohalobium sp.]